jgi:intracellular multiplication protein IcmO
VVRRYVEDRHEARVSRRVVDVRPAGVQYAEWLSEKFNLFLVVSPQLALAVIVPVLAPFLLFSAIGHVIAHRVTKPVLPFRYPAGNKEPDHKGRTGTGILLLGNVEADSEYEKFKEIWLSDDDCRKHMLIIGSTGSGKSETLKGIFFNSLCWSSGFFVADGKADNKLPTDTFTMVRSFGRDDDLLYLNFLLGGRTPEQVRRSRRRRTNKINPVSSADADTIIQMGANMLPKVEGEGKNWQEKALNLWRAEIQALCYLRDTEGTDLSVSTIIEYMALPRIEELYMKGYEEFLARGEWSYGYAGIKAYLESGCPAYKIDKLLAKHGHGDQVGQMPGGRPAPAGKAFDQDSMAYEQHAYRTTQLMPVLNLLDKTYGFIFRDKYPEIDMIDVTLNNRILVMLIPSLEKSAQEAENLGKLAIACLRVMMGKNLGADIEGTRSELLTSKATAAPYPYTVALDELAYYFADGIAVMFAQARSLGFQMIAAAQDLEKLTEGGRAAEAGAMLANQVAKWFMRIDDAGKTYEFINKILGKVSVALRRTYELANVGYRRSKEIDIQEIERVSLREMQEKGPGEAVFNSAGRTVRAKSLYVGDDLDKHRTDNFFVLRFLQVEPPSNEEIDANSIPADRVDDPTERGSRMLEILRYERSRTGQLPPSDPMVNAVAAIAKAVGPSTKAAERAIALYQAARRVVVGVEEDKPDGIGEGRQTSRDVSKQPAAQQVTTNIDQTPVVVGAVDDEGIDPLAFLSSPFERKPADILLAQQAEESALLSAEAGAMGLDALPESQGLVDRIVSTGNTLNLRRPSPESEFAAAEAATLRALTGMAPPTEQGADAGANWISDAVGAANMVLAARSADGKTVVGFSDQTADQVAQIEELLGSPAPKSAAKRLEVVVSAQVTPDLEPEALLQEADIDEFFNNLSRNKE